MTNNEQALWDLFDRFDNAEFRILFADDTEFRTTDPVAAMERIIQCDPEKDDPWIDLVDGDGQAVGITLPGDWRVVDPVPSYTADGGMIYLLERGVRIPEQQQGKHMLSVFDVLETEDDPLLYTIDDLSISTPGSETEITLSQGRHRMEKQGNWKPVKSVFGQFSDALQNHVEGKKDGPCFLQGECAGGARKAMAMIANYIIGVDLDSGKPLDDVMDAIIEAGLEAVVYTTHSHLKNTSQIKRDHFLKWTDGADPTPELVSEYLRVKKGIISEIVDQVEIIDDSHHTEEGVVILVEHRPIPKFRAVFPLTEPFVFAKRGGPQKDAIAEWKERYAGFATKMGFFFDETCCDPARLFYLPRHKRGDKHGSWWVAGKPVDLDEYDRTKVRRDRRNRGSEGPANVFTELAGGVGDDDDRERYLIGDFNLVGWAKKNAKQFEIENFLTDLVPDAIREVRGGKPGVHVECPFEAEHSNFGGGGTFVVNASDNLDEGYDSGFSFNCVHDACSHRDRLDFLKGCIEEGMFTVEDLQKTEHLAELEEEEDDETDKADQKSEASSSPKYEEPADDSLDEETRSINYFNKNYAVVSTSGGARILVEPQEAADDIVFYTQSDIGLIERNRFLYLPTKNGKTERVEAFKHWLESEDRRTYKKVLFEPGHQTPPSTYNLFRGFPIDPIKGDWSMLKDHICDNICEGDPKLFDWFMTWMAQLVQRPGRKPGSSIVVTGEKGTGKSTTFDYLSKLLGQHAISVSQRKQIVGNFNGHMSTALLMVCEEAFWAADPQGEGTLKDLITSETALIEKKGYDPIKAKSYMRLVLLSNSYWVVPASVKDERRFGVFKCSDARRGDIEFFDALRNQMDHEGGLQAMMYDLLHYQPDTGGFGILFTPPETKYLKQQAVESLSGVDRFMLDLMRAGIYESTNENVDPVELDEDKETIVYSLTLRACIEDYVRMKFASDRARTSYDEIGRLAESWFGASEFRVDNASGQNKKRALRFPPLSQSRAELKERKGLEVDVLEIETLRTAR